MLYPDPITVYVCVASLYKAEPLFLWMTYIGMTLKDAGSLGRMIVDRKLSNKLVLKFSYTVY